MVRSYLSLELSYLLILGHWVFSPVQSMRLNIIEHTGICEVYFLYHLDKTPKTAPGWVAIPVTDHVTPSGSERHFVIRSRYERNSWKSNKKDISWASVALKLTTTTVPVWTHCFCIILLVLSQVQLENDADVITLWGLWMAIPIGMYGAPSWNILSKSPITFIIWTAVKYRWLATPWRILNYEVTVSLLSLAGAPSHHYSLEKVEGCQLRLLVTHLPEQPCVVYAYNVGARPRIINSTLQAMRRYFIWIKYLIHVSQPTRPRT